MTIDEIRLLQYGDILRGEQGSSEDPITASNVCPFEVFAVDLKNFLLQSFNEDGSLQISSYINWHFQIAIITLYEVIALELIDALDGQTRCVLEWVANDQIKIKAGSQAIGSERGFVFTQDVTMDLDDDLDAGSKAADTAYNVWIGIDSEEDPIYKFSLSNTAPTGVYSGVCVGMICTDSSSNIKKFTQAGGRINFHIPYKATGSVVSGNTYSYDFSPSLTPLFAGIIQAYSSTYAFNIGDTYNGLYRVDGFTQFKSNVACTLTFSSSGSNPMMVLGCDIWR